MYLRECLPPPRYCLVRHGDDLVATTLNYIHGPEPEACALEYALLSRAVSGSR